MEPFCHPDLNYLYRVINRNNRLKRLLDLGAPGYCQKREAHAQETVDALIDNGRRRPITGPGEALKIPER